MYSSEILVLLTVLFNRRADIVPGVTAAVERRAHLAHRRKIKRIGQVLPQVALKRTVVLRHLGQSILPQLAAYSAAAELHADAADA